MSDNTYTVNCSTDKFLLNYNPNEKIYFYHIPDWIGTIYCNLKIKFKTILEKNTFLQFVNSIYIIEGDFVYNHSKRYGKEKVLKKITTAKYINNIIDKFIEIKITDTLNNKIRGCHIIFEIGHIFTEQNINFDIEYTVHETPSTKEITFGQYKSELEQKNIFNKLYYKNIFTNDTNINSYIMDLTKSYIIVPNNNVFFRIYYTLDLIVHVTFNYNYRYSFGVFYQSIKDRKISKDYCLVCFRSTFIITVVNSHGVEKPINECFDTFEVNGINVNTSSTTIFAYCGYGIYKKKTNERLYFKIRNYQDGLDLKRDKHCSLEDAKEYLNSISEKYNCNFKEEDFY